MAAKRKTTKKTRRRVAKKKVTKRRKPRLGHGGNRRTARGLKPTQYSEALAEQVLSRLVHGDALGLIETDGAMPTRQTVWYWTQGKLGAPTAFKDDYVRARQLQGDGYAEKVIQVALMMDDKKRAAVEKALEGLGDHTPAQVVNQLVFQAERRSTEASKALIDAYKWTSARMHPGRWGDSSKLLLGGIEDGPPVSVDFSEATTEQLERLEAIAAELSRPPGE